MDKINLHGSWELLLDEEQQGIKEHFYKSETPFPKQIQLPTTISEAKLTPRRDLASTDHLGYHVSLAQPTVWNIDHTPCVRWNQRAKNHTR